MERLCERLQNGFRPLVIELSSGKRLKVPHPDFVALGKGVAVVIGEDDSVTTVDALHIASIQDVPAPKRRR